MQVIEWMIIIFNNNIYNNLFNKVDNGGQNNNTLSYKRETNTLKGSDKKLYNTSYTNVQKILLLNNSQKNMWV